MSSQQMESILEVDSLRKCYKNFVLDNISFQLQKNRITGFIGTNGSGKTTTIKLILGIALKDSGKIKLFGKDISQNERELKNRIGVVLDEGFFYEDLTINEMKSIIAASYTNWDNNLFYRNIERFGLHKNQKISSLSKGMRMKYSIALALSHHAGLLIMDEPTSGLDPLIRSELLVILKEFMNKEGNSVFFSTHITSDLDKIADTLILIDKGKIIFSEDKNNLLSKYGKVRGKTHELTKEKRGLFLSILELDNSFEGITNNISAVKENFENIIIERATIEEIMLSNIGRDKQ